MADKPIIINDRRRFTSEGDVRPDAPPLEPKAPRNDSPIDSSAEHAKPKESGPQLVETSATEAAAPTPAEPEDPNQPPPLTGAQLAEARRAYDATADRLDTVIRAQNPGMEHLPPMSFERFVQSIYMQAIMQLGGGTEPGQDPAQAPRIDLLGARQSIDMLQIIADKTRNNLNDPEQKLIEAALFEMQMGFLEITQHLAQQAARRQPIPPPPGTPTGPNLVR